MRNHPTLMIIADDLTGAADCAARWRNSGQPAEVRLTPTTESLGPGATALVSDSRHLTANAAAQQVSTTIANLNTTANLRWYKKIDSTLRGNLGAELDAALSALDKSHALICPAFPDQQRGLQNGILICPPQIAAPVNLASRLAEQSHLTSGLIPLDVVRSAGDLATALVAAAENANLLICDAMTNNDLTRIAAAASQALPNALLCGSAGLMGALAAQEQPMSDHLQLDDLPTCKSATIIVGSGSILAHQQLQVLQRHYAAQVATICVDTTTLENEGLPKNLPDHVSPLITLIHQQAPEAGTPLDGPLARIRATILAEQAERCIRYTRPELLILVGGDTALSVLRRLSVERLIMLRELLPGVPLARAIRANRQELLVVLKAGSFGDPQTLVELLGLCLRPIR